MSPYATVRNQEHEHHAYAEACRDITECKAASAQCSNLADVRLGQLRIGVSAAAERLRKPKANSMGRVLAGRDPLKVVAPVVESIAVDMVGLIVQRASAMERLRHKLMNGATYDFAVNEKSDNTISTVYRTEDRLTGRARARTHSTSDVPKRRHFVGKVSDLSPLFSGKLFGSHREPPCRVPVVRPECGATTPLGLNLIVADGGA